jgi:hypothetical protein
MNREDLVTLGDFLDFLEWRRLQGRPVYLFPAPPKPVPQIVAPRPKRGALPALRLCHSEGRLYTIGRGSQLYRLKPTFGNIKTASQLSGCAFTDNKSSFINVIGHPLWPTYSGPYVVLVGTPRVSVRVIVQSETVSSLYENGDVVYSRFVRDGNTVAFA